MGLSFFVYIEKKTLFPRITRKFSSTEAACGIGPRRMVGLHDTSRQVRALSSYLCPRLRYLRKSYSKTIRKNVTFIFNLRQYLPWNVLLLLYKWRYKTVDSKKTTIRFCNLFVILKCEITLYYPLKFQRLTTSKIKFDLYLYMISNTWYIMYSNIMRFQPIESQLGTSALQFCNRK